MNKIIVFNKVSFHKKCFKHFTDYKDNNASIIAMLTMLIYNASKNEWYKNV